MGYDDWILKGDFIVGMGHFFQRGTVASFAFFAGIGIAEAADLVVIKSNVQGIAKGTVLDDSKPISVPAGNSVSLVSGTGTVITIAGPFEGVPAQRGGAGGGDGRLVASLATLLQGHGADQTQLGATRAGDAEVPDDPFHVDISRSADHCLPAGSTAKLWRPTAAKMGRGKLKSLESGGLQKEFSWNAGEMLADWPAGVPMQDGAAYLITSSDRPTPARIILHLIPASVGSGVQQAAWMAEKGCSDQAMSVIAALR